MKREEAIARAIEIAQGRECEEGAAICHPSNEFTMALLRYEGEEAVCDDAHQGEMRFPRSEVFDPNLVLRIALCVERFGYWKDGMQVAIL